MNEMMKKDIRQKIEATEKEVDSLQQKVYESTTDLHTAKKTLQILYDFYELEFQEQIMKRKVTPRFIDITIRQACRIILKENITLHISDIQRILEEGGRKVIKTSITSILIRSQEFVRAPGLENTFKLKEN